ncbi:MAG: BamA/TamA family outer membrane protein [Bacteroidales bacterium]|nr:BamA/TamA family outer membrane protein [Bacteroidales bacterium]
MKIKKPISSILMLVFFMSSVSIMAQDNSSVRKEKDCNQKDLRDLLRKKDNKPKPPREVMLLVLPNVSSNPANGVLLGMAGSIGWFWGPRENTRVSAAGFSAAYTTKNQFLSFCKTNIYTTDDKFFLQGDWRYYIYNAPTWGLGTDAPDTVSIPSTWSWQGADVDETDGAYPMDYNYFKFHQTVNRKIVTFLYAGLGYHLDMYTKIDDNLLQTDTLPAQLTPHYIYSKLYDFSPERYVVSGLSLNFFYDSRDNLINPYKGYYANINYRYNPGFLGSDQNSSSLWLEFRTYVGLSKKMPRHLVAFWLFGNFQISGDQPYLTLMALGEDQRARSGRAYVAGRYRGEDLVYGEVEYRFPISQCSKILGGVIFLNLTTASNRTTDIPLFAYVRPGAGFGFRFMINKHFRTNINLDFGFGQKSKGFYFSGTETF